MVSFWDKLTLPSSRLCHLTGFKFLSAFVVVQALLVNGSLPVDELEWPLALCEPGVNPEEQLVSSSFVTGHGIIWLVCVIYV